MNPEKITIITVVYNNANQVLDAVKSVLMQDYPNIEYIVVDGASKDNTLEVLEPFKNKFAKLISEPDKNHFDAMNKGIAASTAEWIGILNSDDVYADPTVITHVMEVFKATQADAVYGDLIYVKDSQPGKIIRYWRSGPFKRSNFLFGWMPPHPSFFLRKDAYLKHGLYRTDLSLSGDYELMLRMLYKFKLKAVWLPNVLVRFRMGGKSNANMSNRIKANKEDKYSWTLNDIKPYFFTLWLKPPRKVLQFFRKPA